MVACHKNHHGKCRRIVRMVTQRTSVRIHPNTLTQLFIVTSLRTSNSIPYLRIQIFFRPRKVTCSKFHTEDPQIPRYTEQNSGARGLCISLYTLTYTLWELLCVRTRSDSQRQLQKIQRVRKMKEPSHSITFRTRLPVSQTSTRISSHDHLATAWYKTKRHSRNTVSNNFYFTKAVGKFR
jgi:hypothetical protein